MKQFLCFVVSALLCFNAYADRLNCQTFISEGKFIELMPTGLGKFYDTNNNEIIFSFAYCAVIRAKQ